MDTYTGRILPPRISLIGNPTACSFLPLLYPIKIAHLTYYRPPLSVNSLYLKKFYQRDDQSKKGITQDPLRPAQPLRGTKDEEGIFCDHRSGGLAEFRDPLITLALCFALCQSRNFLRYWWTGRMLGPTDTTPKYGVLTVFIDMFKGTAL